MLRNTLLVLLAFIASGQCEHINNVLPRMVGGVATLVGEHPSVVSIRVPQQNPAAPNTYCVGSFINLNHILTSSQCVHNSTNHLINPSWFRIIAGDLDMLVPSFRRFSTSASHIYTHPSYTVNPLTNDIAVIRTVEPFPSTHNSIDWAIRNAHVLPVGQVCRYVGWGTTTTTGIINPVQQRLDVPILNRDVCNAANVHQGRVLDHMICAGATAATSGACTGNLGGPLFCNVNNWWQLTGILSFGINCGTANSPGVYTQVRFFDAWINTQLTRTDATPAGTLVVA